MRSWSPCCDRFTSFGTTSSGHPCRSVCQEVPFGVNDSPPCGWTTVCLPFISRSCGWERGCFDLLAVSHAAVSLGVPIPGHSSSPDCCSYGALL